MKPIIGDIVFLLGAGASRGAAAGHVLPDSPPLMTELYDRLAQRYPSEWGPSSNRAAHANRYRENFEKAFAEIDLRRAPDMPPGVRGAPGLTAIEAQRPLAVYFSEFRIDGARKDLYSRLLNYLQRSNLIEACFFSSLNYECLFEQASLRTGRSVEYLLEAAAAPFRGTIAEDWPGTRQSSDVDYVLKLHGSCNFSTPVDQMVMAQLSTGNTHVEVRIDSSDPLATLTESAAARIFPVMTQISPDRDDFLASGKIFQIRQMWERAIRHASLIVVIGVAPRRYDTHIWNPLSVATGDILYIGARGDTDTWRECNARFRSLGETFSEGFRPLLRCLAAHRKGRGAKLWNYLWFRPLPLERMRQCPAVRSTSKRRPPTNHVDRFTGLSVPKCAIQPVGEKACRLIRHPAVEFGGHAPGTSSITHTFWRTRPGTSGRRASSASWAEGAAVY